MAELPDDDRFHFGYTQFEPIVNVYKALFILAACVFALFSAFDSLQSGGNPLEFGFAMLYGVLATTGCLSFGIYIKHKAKKTNSGLLKVDAVEWIVDGMLSLAVLLGFVFGYVLQLIGKEHLTPSVDPMLLILITIIALPVPFKILASNVREIIVMAPPEPFVDELEKHLVEATKDIPLDDFEYRIMKQGRQTFVLLHLIVSDDFRFNTVSDLDDIRDQIEGLMLDFNREIVLEIIFIKDKEWADFR